METKVKTVFHFLVLLLVVSQIPNLTMAVKEENRNMLTNLPLMTTSTQEGTNIENQIVGTIPLIPTLKIGLLSAISTVFLPGLHFILTVITMIFALVGVASFICSNYDCGNILRGDESGFSHKNRHSMYQKNLRTRNWETVPAGLFNSLENSYLKYKDPRGD